MSAGQEKGSTAAGPSERGSGALWVGAGILLSRLSGLLQTLVSAHFLGNSTANAAFQAALRIPNFMQNLFGEGVLSASFIPVYSALLGKGDREEADRVAGIVLGLLSLVTGISVAAGILATPWLVDLVAPGFDGETRRLVTDLVRILFPALGFLVLSAWCLGILNSHRRFFLSYSVPVIWNGALVVALLIFGPRVDTSALARILAGAAVAGGFFQLAVQVRPALSLLGRFRPAIRIDNPNVRQVLRSFGPVFVGRGVVQISAYVDTAIASVVQTAVMGMALSVLAYAQRLYLLPVSLFGMAVAAAELPAMSRLVGPPEEVASGLRERLSSGLGRIAYFVIPSACAFFVLGDVVGGVLQSGRFGAEDTRYLWFVLMGSSVGLLAQTLGRLYSTTLYALKDTATPLWFALVRVALGAALAWGMAVEAPSLVGLPKELGAVGITLGSGIAAWVELLLLRREVGRRVGRVEPSGARLAVLWGSAILAAAVGTGVKALLAASAGSVAFSTGGPWVWLSGILRLLPPPNLPGPITACLVLLPYGAVYFALTWAAQVPEARALMARLMKK